jgi:hypothetical protein
MSTVQCVLLDFEVSDYLVALNFQSADTFLWHLICLVIQRKQIIFILEIYFYSEWAMDMGSLCFRF